jgi:hypothetical protein
MQTPVRPNLLAIGAMKASTTLLYDMLRRHPEVWFSEEKEPHYFTDPNFAAADCVLAERAEDVGCDADGGVGRVGGVT